MIRLTRTLKFFRYNLYFQTAGTKQAISCRSTLPENRVLFGSPSIRPFLLLMVKNRPRDLFALFKKRIPDVFDNIHVSNVHLLPWMRSTKIICSYFFESTSKTAIRKKIEPPFRETHRRIPNE